MKKLSTIIILLACVSLITVSVSASPQLDRSRRRASIRPDTGRILNVLKAKQDELEITDEQLNKIEELTIKMEDKTVEIKNDLAKIQLELRRELRDREERDYDQLKSLITQSANLRADMIINRMKLKDEINHVLTEEQITALKDMFKKALARRRILNRRDELQRNPDQRRSLRK